jgi:hypothetical protein
MIEKAKGSSTWGKRQGNTCDRFQAEYTMPQTSGVAGKILSTRPPLMYSASATLYVDFAPRLRASRNRRIEVDIT